MVSSAVRKLQPALVMNTRFFIQLTVAAKTAFSVTLPSRYPAIWIHAILANINPEHKHNNANQNNKM